MIKTGTRRFRRRPLLGAMTVLARNAQAHAEQTAEPVKTDSLPASPIDRNQLHQISNEGGAVNALLKAAGFNVPKVLPAISVAMDFAAGRTDWFTAPDKLLGQRLSNDENVTDRNLMRAWSRQWQKLKKEQARTAIVLVERQAGGRDAMQRKMPSLMRVPLLELVARTIERAEKMVGFQGKRRGESLEKAAREIVGEIQPRQESDAPKDRFRRPPTDDANMNTREIRAILSLAKRVQKRVEKNGGDSAELKERLKQLIDGALDGGLPLPE
jgi:hypothetical protein